MSIKNGHFFRTSKYFEKKSYFYQWSNAHSCLEFLAMQCNLLKLPYVNYTTWIYLQFHKQWLTVENNKLQVSYRYLRDHWISGKHIEDLYKKVIPLHFITFLLHFLMKYIKRTYRVVNCRTTRRLWYAKELQWYCKNLGLSASIHCNIIAVLWHTTTLPCSWS